MFKEFGLSFMFYHKTKTNFIIIFNGMIGRQQNKKKSKLKQSIKGHGKQKSSLIIKGLVPGQKGKDPEELQISIIRKKYIDKQIMKQLVINVQNYVQNKHKIMTELRIRCIQKEYLLDFYSNPEIFLQTKIISVSSSVSSQLGTSFPHIHHETSLGKITRSYFRAKAHLYSAKNNRIQLIQKNAKNKNTQILSTGWDSSDICLKTLVSKIQNMIQKDGSTIFPQDGKILNEINDVNPHQYELIRFFDDGHNKISEICPKDKLCFDEYNETKEDCIQVTNEPFKLGQTEPLKSMKKNTNLNQYGIPQGKKPTKKEKGGKKREGSSISSSKKLQRSIGKEVSRNSSRSTGKKQLAKSKKSKLKMQVYKLQPSLKKKQLKRNKSPAYS